jgi:SAM-dependent methyltransferase
MLQRLLAGASGPILDLGCGDGSTSERVAASAPTFGCDQSAALLRVASAKVPVVQCRLPDLSWVRTGSVGCAYAVYVLDLLEDAETFFAEAARVVRDEGTLAVIINHPAFTAPESGPFLDDDGEVMWRWGDYFNPGPSPTLAGSTPLTMHHRPLGTLLTLAATAGWSLRGLEERGLAPEAVAAEPGYAGQESIPRLLGARWRRTHSS